MNKDALDGDELTAIQTQLTARIVIIKRIFLAWQSIAADIENGHLNQDLSHLNQAKRNRDGADQSLAQLVRETYKWLIAPVEAVESFPLNSGRRLT